MQDDIRNLIAQATTHATTQATTASADKKPDGRHRPSVPPAHTYPSEYPPGRYWHTTAAWEILDFLTPGTISLEARALLAGMIGGRLVKERERAARLANQGRAPHVANAILRCDD